MHFSGITAEVAMVNCLFLQKEKALPQGELSAEAD